MRTQGEEGHPQARERGQRRPPGCACHQWDRHLSFSYMEGPFGGEIPSGEKQIFLIMAILPQWGPNRCSKGLMGYQPQGSTGAKASWAHVTQNWGAVGPVHLGERIRVQYWTVGQRLLVRWVLLNNDRRQGQWGHVLTNTIYYIWKGSAVKLP